VRSANRVDTEHVAGRIFLYDGDCAFCSSCARWLQRWAPTAVPVRPWQFTDIDALGVTAAECDTAVQWIDGTHRAAGPAAIAALLRSSHRGWRLVGRTLGTPAATALTWPFYRWVARNRDRMPGGTATCALPSTQRGAGDPSHRSESVTVSQRD
jgi:predicted DCC family thiol-disulfide oxidoreductase YuxK